MTRMIHPQDADLYGGVPLTKYAVEPGEEGEETGDVPVLCHPSMFDGRQ